MLQFDTYTLSIMNALVARAFISEAHYSKDVFVPEDLEMATKCTPFDIIKIYDVGGKRFIAFIHETLGYIEVFVRERPKRKAPTDPLGPTDPNSPRGGESAPAQFAQAA